MGFIGEYTADRANAKVEAKGDNEAKITVEWGSSATGGVVWEMQGTFDSNALTVKYTNGTKAEYEYTDDGKTRTETVDYTDGTGTITFKEGNPLSFTWDDEKEHVADGMTFEFSV